MNIFKRIFRPKIEVVTFTKKQINERELINKKCAQLASEIGYKWSEKWG